VNVRAQDRSADAIPPRGPAAEIRLLERRDLRAAAELHQRVFADYFLGHMGRRFLELFYAEFVGNPGNYGFVAIREHRLVGTVIGSVDLDRFFHDFYRRRFLSLAGAVAAQIIRDPYVRGNLPARVSHVGRAARSWLGRSPRRETAASSDWPPAQLLSIGLDEEPRGMGIAEALVARFCDALAADGVDAVGLSVRPDNPRAIAFYERTGWLVQRVGPTSVTFCRSLDPARDRQP
jgi:ribosomal protein S18 acetylase RimI-like enzyme